MFSATLEVGNPSQYASGHAAEGGPDEKPDRENPEEHKRKIGEKGEKVSEHQKKRDERSAVNVAKLARRLLRTTRKPLVRQLCIFVLRIRASTDCFLS